MNSDTTTSLEHLPTHFPDIPGYCIRKLIGEGGFARVFLATQLSLGRDIALKVMDPALADDPQFCERFMREGRDLANIGDHASIVTIHDIDRCGPYYYIAMQYLPGPTLRQQLDANQPYQHPLHFIARIADALAKAHAAGLVHRDIKPANILFDDADEAVLSDFGIAKARHRSMQLTEAGILPGTPKYMSPEQIRGSDTLDGRSDLYSLGVVLFEALARRPPYFATDAMSVMAMHLNDPIPRLPPAEAMYQPLIDRLMAKRPEERYADAHELIDDINQRYFAPLSRPPDTQRRQLPMLAGAAALLLALGVTLATAFGLFGQPAQTSDCPGLSAGEHDRVASLLDIAQIHEEVGRVTQPPGANAVEAYSRALEFDPCNQNALKALKRLGSN